MQQNITNVTYVVNSGTDAAGGSVGEDDPNWVPPPLGMPEELTVIVTGVNTFIGSHVALCFLHNNFKVRGTVFKKDDRQRLIELKKAFGDKFDLMHIVEWNLKDETRFKNLCNGVRFIVHAHDYYSDEIGYNPMHTMNDSHEAILAGALHVKA